VSDFDRVDEDVIDRLARESREDLGKDVHVDWARVDDELFARVETEAAAERTVVRHRGRRSLWVPLSIGLAAAAAVALVVGRGHDRALDGGAQLHVDTAAGSIVAIDGASQVLVDDKPAAPGRAIEVGDVIETQGAPVTLERAGVTWLVERSSRVRVSRVAGALVVALERGAVEAQVARVATGEAFAVDVGASRVAVHGTHLRVARDGDHVTVDLNEGMVSVGMPPRVGSTYGDLVTAPAHADFSASDAHSTLLVSHEPGSVRTPIAFGNVVAASPATAPPSKSDPAPSLVPTPSPPPTAPPTALAVAPPQKPEPHLVPPAASSVQLIAVEPNDAETTIANAVRACMEGPAPAPGVTVVKSTTLTLELYETGMVKIARFWPFPPPEVVTCATTTIYKTRFNRSGTVTIKVELRN
jgi:hypothetical protein